MAIVPFVRVKTVSGKVYELPGKDVPQLWEVSISIHHVNGKTGYVDQGYRSSEGKIHVERDVLEDHGLLPMSDERKKEGITPTKTAEDLILELLEHVGVYPAGAVVP